MKTIYLILACALSSSAFAMQQNTVNAVTAVVDCCICYERPGTINTRTIFACADEHAELLCEPCAHNFRTTRQQVEHYGPREWVCPLCRAPKIGIAPRAQAPAPTPRPAAAPHAPQPQPRPAQPAHNFHHNNNPGGGDDGNNGGKAILLMAAIGTIYFTAKYIYNRFKAQEKPLDDTNNFSEFEFDDTCPKKVIADSDIGTFASRDDQSDISLDEDWFN